MRTVVLLCLVALSGCVTSGSEEGAVAPGTVLLSWESPLLEGPPQDNQNNPPPFTERPPRPECDGENCHRMDFEVPELGGADVLVSIEWEAQDEDYETETLPGGYLGAAAVGMDLAVFQDGRMLIDGTESLHYAGVTRLQAPEPGTYTAEVVARFGQGTYIGAVRVAPALPASGPLLPDLVMLPPDHLTISVPVAREGDPFIGLITPGCGPDESAEDQHLRCLRFAGILGNQGQGPFEANLMYDQAQASMTDDGYWVQRVYDADGSSTTSPIGPASYHAIHGHYHILDYVETKLYAYDLETGRGQDMTVGNKAGFCVIDGGLVDPLAPQATSVYDGVGCCYMAGFCQMDMASQEYFLMGMSPGWYDIYPWWRSDQYIEISGVPDGVYELVSVIDPTGIMSETDPSNNEASTVFRLTGDDVEMLEQRTQADVGPHPDADWA